MKMGFDKIDFNCKHSRLGFVVETEFTLLNGVSVHKHLPPFVACSTCGAAEPNQFYSKTGPPPSTTSEREACSCFL